VAGGRAGVGFTIQIAIWLWFTVIFANFAEAMAEGRGKAQADALRNSRTQTHAKRLEDPTDHLSSELTIATKLRRGDHVLCGPADGIPSGRSGAARAAVSGGTKVLSDYLVIRITANPGETFIDRMIALVEGASRQKTPNEITLTILLAGV